MRVTSVHERWLDADIHAVGELIDALASDDDRLWPSRAWPAQRFDRPVEVGAVGGHGPVRYEVDAVEPGRHVGYQFRPGIGITGRHWITAVKRGTGVSLSHVIDAEAGVRGWLQWTLVFGPLHDALIEDALDNAERLLTDGTGPARRWSWWVRSLRRLFRSPSRRVSTRS